MAIRVSSGLKNQLLISSSVREALEYGVIDVYSGAQPVTAETSPTGTFLGRITANGDPWVEGAEDAGLLLAGVPSANMLIAYPTQTWTLRVVASGIAGWFRFRSNASSATSFDGEISAPFEELFIGDPSLVVGQTRAIESFSITF